MLINQNILQDLYVDSNISTMLFLFLLLVLVFVLAVVLVVAAGCDGMVVVVGC
jgi:hypothetical protein